MSTKVIKIPERLNLLLVVSVQIAVFGLLWLGFLVDGPGCDRA